MSEPIVFVESFRIRPGKSDQLRQALADLCAKVEAREPQLIAYKIYTSDDGTEGTALHIHRNDESLEHHQNVIGEIMGPVAELIDLVSIKVCGDPAEERLQQVRAMAHAFGNVSLVMSQFQAGFVRAEP